jgi:histidyl-tRNA synthetase
MLVADIGGRPTPAAGFAVGVERMVMASSAPEPQTPRGIFIAVTSREMTSAASKLAADLRKAGLRTEGPVGFRSLKSQLGAADKMGLSTVIIMADEEMRDGDVIIKNMSDGTQKKTKLSGVAELLAAEPA